MTTKPKRIIYALSLEEANNEEIYEGIRYAIDELFQYFSACEIRNMALAAVDEFLEGRNELRNLDNTPYTLPSDEELFGNDPYFRWLDKCYLGRGKRQDEEFSFHRARNLKRIILLDVFLQIKFGMSIARHYR